MPVILTTQEEINVWMTAPPLEALRLQRPLPDDALMIVARGEKKDEGVLSADNANRRLIDRSHFLDLDTTISNAGTNHRWS